MCWDDKERNIEKNKSGMNEREQKGEKAIGKE